jgi:dipeptidase D
MLRIVLLSLLSSLPLSVAAQALPPRALAAAEHAASRYEQAQVDLLAELVRFRTVHEPGIANADHPEFRAFNAHLGQHAKSLGFDVTDLGAALVIGMGEADQRLGIATHGDVQPADPSKWRSSPFELDTESEPGRLIARGSEDDKGPIATALYAMKTLKDLGLPLSRRIELIVSLTEESDWTPFRELLTRYTPPPINIALDSQYPVVVAEKGWGGLWVTFAGATGGNAHGIERFEGGAFISQVPEDASLVLSGAEPEVLREIQARIRAADDSAFRLEPHGGGLIVHAKGTAAHSATPEQGRNALTMLAALFEGLTTIDSASGQAVDFVNALVGTGWEAERFGEVAYAHPMMGPLTLNLSTARTTAQGVELAINLRAPAGKSPEQLDGELRAAIASWAGARGVAMPEVRTDLTAAHYPAQAPQTGPLLAVFRHYTGLHGIEPVSIGGATHARLLPNAVNFGPAMPGVAYTGHSEHEYITREQMSLNLRMYAAMLAWLAGEERQVQDASRNAMPGERHDHAR